MNKDRLRQEALRQGREYSRKVMEEYESFWGSSHWDFVRRERARWMLSQAQRLLNRDTEPWNLLEIGCGIGFTTLEVIKLGLLRIQSLLAIDMATKALEVARDLLAREEDAVKERVSFREENFFDHTGGPYHLIFMHEVFEHMPDPAAIFSKVNDLLCPGGLFMVSTPNAARLSNRVLGLIGRDPQLLDPYHIKEYTLSELLTGAAPLTPLSYTGRALLDELVLGGLLSLGNRGLFRRLMPLVRRLIHTRTNYYAGFVIPSMSSELWLLYRKHHV